jgi:hypothetical protein
MSEKVTLSASPETAFPRVRSSVAFVPRPSYWGRRSRRAGIRNPSRKRAFAPDFCASYGLVVGKSASDISVVQVGLLFRIHPIAETMLKARPSLIAFARHFDDVVFAPVTQLLTHSSNKNGVFPHLAVIQPNKPKRKRRRHNTSGHE